MGQNLFIGAARLFQSIAQDGQAVEGKLVGDALRQFDYGTVIPDKPIGPESDDGAKGVAEDVKEERANSRILRMYVWGSAVLEPADGLAAGVAPFRAREPVGEWEMVIEPVEDTITPRLLFRAEQTAIVEPVGCVEDAGQAVRVFVPRRTHEPNEHGRTSGLLDPGGVRQVRPVFQVVGPCHSPSASTTYHGTYDEV
jgi:hypothetical protein